MGKESEKAYIEYFNPDVEVLDISHQDLFFKYENLELPIAAWVMRSIVDYAYTLLNEVLGVKALS